MVRAHAGEVQLSRITRALKALVTPDEKMATVVNSPRDQRGTGPYQNPNVDQPISASRAPPGTQGRSGSSTGSERHAGIWNCARR